MLSRVRFISTSIRSKNDFGHKICIERQLESDSKHTLHNALTTRPHFFTITTTDSTATGECIKFGLDFMSHDQVHVQVVMRLLATVCICNNRHIDALLICKVVFDFNFLRATYRTVAGNYYSSATFEIHDYLHW